MAEVAAGKDVLSYCNKCKLTLSHTIVVMKDAKTIGKVQCNTCKSVHAYKMASNAPTRKPTAKKTASGRSRRPSAAEVPLSQVWEETLERSKATKKTYSPKACFVIGDVLDHPTFGIGIVEKVFDKNKMEVLFKDNFKTLIHNVA